MNRGGRWNRNKRGGFDRGGRGRSDRGFGRGNRHDNRDNQPTNQWKSTRRDLPDPRISEKEIGITEYVSDHEGFAGVIKWRYSDFQVSEINEEGVVAKLTDLEPPTPPEEEVIDDDESLLLNKYNLEILPLEMWNKLNALALSPSKTTDVVVEIEADNISKEERTKMHEAVKKAFGSVIVGSTVNVDGKKFIKFERYRKGVYVDNRVKWSWPAEYVHFVLYKENCDTMEAAALLASRLKITLKSSMLGYAGTKDRRAKTSQWASARKLDPRKLHSAARDLRDIHIGNYSFSHTHIKLGMLSGNRFRIAIRGVKDAASAERACSLVCARGFLNYFGLQRFGSHAHMPTHRLGKYLLQGNYKEAINGILHVRPGPLERALTLYAREGARAACGALRGAPPNATEVRLLRALADRPNDLQYALDKVPRNVRLLYVHSYQSYIWNRAVSRRVTQHGLNPVVGDLVFATKALYQQQTPLYEEIINQDDPEDAETKEEQTQDGADTQDGAEIQDGEHNALKYAVKTLTQEDIDSATYSIFDVVMPLPGVNVEFPAHLKDYYEELAKEDGLSLTLKNKSKSFKLSGAYRAIACRPRDARWTHVRYSALHADLIASDWDELKNVSPAQHDEEGKYQALILSVTLPSSCYATMLLRELMKTDTSAHAQALLSQQALKRPADDDRNDDDDSDAKHIKLDDVLY